MSSRGRGRGRGHGFHQPPYENYDFEAAERPGRNRQQFFAEDEYSNRNFVNDMNLGARLGNSRPRQDPQINHHPPIDGGKMQQFMPDPRLVQHGNKQYECNPGGNSDYRIEDFNRKGKSLRPLNSSETNNSFIPYNEESITGVTRLTREIPLEAKNVDRRFVSHAIDERFDRRPPVGMSSKPSDTRNQVVNMNLDSIVHNLLDSFQLDAHVNDGCDYDNQLHREEEEDEPDDFPSRYASYQQSFNDTEQVAIALSGDARSNNLAISSTQCKNKSTRENQPTARVKPEPRDMSGVLLLDPNLENNLKKALEDIRQRQITTSHSSYKEIDSSKESRKTNESLSKKAAIPSSSSRKSKEIQPSPEPSDKGEKSRRTVVDNTRSSSRNQSRSNRNDSPLPGRGRDFPVLGSPEWHRQVRIVDKQPDRHRDSREREMRRVRRARSNSRSRSRSRSSRRSQRYFRLGSPERRRTRSRSRSRSSRRGHRVSRSPDRPSRRMGRLSRNSRSPPRVRDRRRSPTEYIHRNVVERTVIVRHRSRSYSRSRSRSASKSSSVKRLKESHDNVQEIQPVANPAESPIATNQPPQFFTRGFVAAANNQADYVVQPTLPQLTSQVSTRYVVPPVQSLIPQPVGAPPMVNFFNPHFQQTPQQQMMAFQQHQQFQQQQQHQQFQQQFHQQQFFQQQHIQKQQHYHHQVNQSVLSYIKPLASSNANTPPSTLAPNPAPPLPISTVSSVEATSVDFEQRIRHTRDSLLEKQAHLIHQLFVLQGQQADMEMKQKTADGNEYERLSSGIVEKAKLEKEMTGSAQSLQKIIQKHTTQLKEDLCELKKARSSNRYSYFDPGQHWCELCDVITEKLPDYLSHLHSKEHEDRLQSTGVPSTPWHKKRQAAIEEDKSDSRIITRIPFNGLQCLQPVKAWYCEMCDVWMGDVHCAQLHMNSNEHNDQHLKRSMDRPEAALNHTMKKQSALRRNAIRKKGEERIRNQKREAEKLKLETQKKEELKKKEEELQEKQKVLNEKWQNFVRQEENINIGVVELEEESSGPTASISVQQSEETASSSTQTVNKNIRLNMRTRLMSTKSAEQDEVKSDSTSPHSVRVDSVEGKSISEQGKTVTSSEESTSVCLNEIHLVDTSVVDKPSSKQNNDGSSHYTSNDDTIQPEVSVGTVSKDSPQTGPEKSTGSGDIDLNSSAAEHPADVPQEGVSSLIDLTNRNSTKELNEAENRLLNTGVSEETRERVSCTSDVDQPLETALETVSRESHGAEKDEINEMDVNPEDTPASPEKMETSENMVLEPLVSDHQQEQMVPGEVSFTPTLLSERPADNIEEKSDQEQSIIPELNLNHHDEQTGLDSMVTTAPKDPIEAPRMDIPADTDPKVSEDNLGILVSENVKESQNVDAVCQHNLPPDVEKEIRYLAGGEESLVPKIEPKDSTCEEKEPLDCCVIMEVNPKLAKVVEVIDLEPSSDESDHAADDNPVKSSTSEKNKNPVVLLTDSEEKCNVSTSDSRSSSCNKSEISVQLSDFIVLSETNDDSLAEQEFAFHSPESSSSKQVELDKEPVNSSTPVP